MTDDSRRPNPSLTNTAENADHILHATDGQKHPTENVEPSF